MKVCWHETWKIRRKDYRMIGREGEGGQFCNFKSVTATKAFLGLRAVPCLKNNSTDITHYITYCNISIAQKSVT